jgi:hypothetical protein
MIIASAVERWRFAAAGCTAALAVATGSRLAPTIGSSGTFPTALDPPTLLDCCALFLSLLAARLRSLAALRAAASGSGIMPICSQ